MAAVSETYPTKPELPAVVRGDPLAIPVTFGDEDDISGWTFRCQFRTWPDGELVVEADVTTAGNVATIALTGTQTALLTGREGFDLEQLTPVHVTWWIVRLVRTEGDYSRDD